LDARRTPPGPVPLLLRPRNLNILITIASQKSTTPDLNLSQQLGSILRHFKLEDSFSNAITDNASENAACLDLLGDELLIDMRKRHIRCMGHVINLIAQEVLFGQDAESFEESVTNVTTIEVELNT
jgi:hypothetical protein